MTPGPVYIDPRHRALVRDAEIKQALYVVRRRVHTDRVRQELLEQREYEVRWQAVICNYHKAWDPKHG